MSVISEIETDDCSSSSSLPESEPSYSLAKKLGHDLIVSSIFLHISLIPTVSNFVCIAVSWSEKNLVVSCNRKSNADRIFNAFRSLVGRNSRAVCREHK